MYCRVIDIDNQAIVSYIHLPGQNITSNQSKVWGHEEAIYVT